MYFIDEKNPNLVLEVIEDPCPENPREFDNRGKFITFAYNTSPDTNDISWTEFLESFGIKKSNHLAADMKSLMDAWKKQGIAGLQVNMYDHSGISFYTGALSNHFDWNWDCSFAGVIYAKIENGETEEQLLDILKGEVEDYNRYLSGTGMYCIKTYDITDGGLKYKDNNDGCCGFWTKDPFGSEVDAAKEYGSEFGFEFTDNTKQYYNCSMADLIYSLRE